MDAAMAEVADQEIDAELAEVVRRQGDAPRRVERSLRGHSSDEGSVRGKGVDVTQVRTIELIVRLGILLGVSHEDHSVGRLNTEWSETGGNVGILESARPLLARE